MHLDSLRVVHLRKQTDSDFDLSRFDAQGFIPQSFVLASCQRFLWVGSENMFKTARSPHLLQGSGFETHVGKDAYLFLLRVATGLESRVVGETDIFGQLKEAWQKSTSCSRELRDQLSPWIQRLFEDTKEIRSSFLRNLGGASYGSLVRKIIQDSPLTAKGPILLIGAGQIARSVVPFLQDQELWLWNRSEQNLRQLEEQIRQKTPGAQVRRLLNEDKDRAWREAAHVVLCVPVDEARDNERIENWKLNRRPGAVIHLGGYRAECGVWAERPEFHALDQLFDLQKSQDRIRCVQVERANRACGERAKLRSMGTSITLPHGWEDLAAFA
ncbi:MAG: hypothetical protein A2X94_14240 [Bdellovibrionales bacterium GWB1_55_8]|nr:MAG: hypothetical protein A2X94_14240 [Bdellovibrionales bacterium GWB1_55_8]